MKIGTVILCPLLVAIVMVGQASSQEVTRDKRTVQYLVNHFVQFFGLSNPGKASEKQDIAANPLKHILMASSAQFSGGSGGSKKSTTPKPSFVQQYEIPSQPERLVQEPSTASSGPSRVELMDSATSTEAAPEPATTESTTTTTTTTTEAPAPSEEPTTEPSTTNTPATEEPPSGPEETTVDPAAVNTLANNDAENRDDNTTQVEDNSIQTTSNSDNQSQQQQQQQYRRPVWNPFGHSTYSHQQLPYTTYFGNNVFLPAPFIPQPFSHFGAYQQQQQPQPQPQQYYHQHVSAAANLIPAASSTSHSRVKMHDQPYDLVTYHDGADSIGSPSSTYQVQAFGKPFSSRYY